MYNRKIEKVMDILKFEHIYLTIRTDRFYYLKFILEAYEGLAILSSSGVRKDIVVIKFPQENRKNVFLLLDSIVEKISPYYS